MFLVFADTEPAAELRSFAFFGQSYSKPRDSSFFSGGVNATYWRRNKLEMAYSFEHRKFASGVKFKDHQFRIMHLAFINRSFSAETELALTPGADFFPAREVTLTPHFYRVPFDFFAGLRFRDYEKTNTLSLRPGVRADLSDSFAIQLQGDVGLRPSKSFAASVFVDQSLAQKIDSRIFFSSGKSDEGDGVFDSFSSVGARLKWRAARVQPSVEYSYYDGELRSEQRYQVNLQAQF
jgi:hypothetical protein